MDGSRAFDASLVLAVLIVVVVIAFGVVWVVQQIDNYLMDWYAVASYEGRAGVGSTLGAAVMRMLGAPAGKKLMSVANSVLAAPGQEKTKNRIGDELMLGLAASGNTEAV